MSSRGPMLGGKQLCIAATALAVVTVFLAQSLWLSPIKQQLAAGRVRIMSGPWEGLTPRFQGEYGASAVRNLSSWGSSLFERTFLLYKEKTVATCVGAESCALEKQVHKMPEPTAFTRYDLFNPFITCPHNDTGLVRVGGENNPVGDGGKWLCLAMLQPPCTIFSLGSQGDYSFEEAMLKHTQCNIYTFDCTYAGRNLSERHQYFQECLGSKEKAAADPMFTTFDAAMARLGVDKIHLLKIDIEGFEYDVMAPWRAGDASLPEQIAVEVHHSEVIYGGGASLNNAGDFSNLLWPVHNMGASDLSLFFQHFASMGYGIVSREDNTAYGTCCSEFLLLKVADWKGAASRARL